MGHSAAWLGKQAWACSRCLIVENLSPVSFLYKSGLIYSTAHIGLTYHLKMGLPIQAHNNGVERIGAIGLDTH